eukprot:1194879-Amphidinium_carterae.1
MVKAVPGFLQVSDLSQWLIGNAVALFSGPTVCAKRVLNAHLMIHRAAVSMGWARPIALNEL